ncbi:Arylsulfatase [Falsiruegeria litorea R37]|uniref:Arylsulfatase n=1 Tax=Falsiruegeria litorea R37 TaxID=1200284 RepID=A0A1Y5TA99_9RHOB|nr:sulfatase-like hydrolase/transferase [Falsiruegeria litorea]SLN58881.1 Arylsulfatase [Falsiruegeria litorea R37]
MAKRPNFLFFITDQQRADWLGCMGHPVVRTPNIDALAARGTIFDDFHVAAPICMPNRASLLTGRMPSVHGLRYNGLALPDTANTFVDVLAADGYRTASIGKNHLQPFLDVPSDRAGETDHKLIPEAWKPDPATYVEEQPANYTATAPYGMKLPYYGFQHVEMVTGHGDRCGGHYQQWFRDRCPDWQALSDPKNELPHSYTCPQAYRTPIPEEFYPTTWIADRAIDYVKDAAGEEDPFFAFVSFPDPHHPFNPPGKYWDMYSPDQFEVGLPYEAHQNPTPPMRHLTEMWEQGVVSRNKQAAFRADPQHIREAMALTAGMITMIDDQIGRVIEALKVSGQLENTVIVFTSDHGEYLGDFGLLLKGALPFRSVTRVPMIWADPDLGQGRSGALTSTIDLSATILERAGLEPYNGIQGQSFLGCIGTQAAHRRDLFMEYNDSGPRLGFNPPARMRSLRNKHWRFTTYGGHDWGELYDLKADPCETRNLWDDPRYASAKAEMSMRLIQHLTAQMDESPLAQKLA